MTVVHWGSHSVLDIYQRARSNRARMNCGKEKSRDSLVRIFATKGFQTDTLKDKDLIPDAFEAAIRRPGSGLSALSRPRVFRTRGSQPRGVHRPRSRPQRGHPFQAPARLRARPASQLLGCGSGKSRNVATCRRGAGGVRSCTRAPRATASALWAKIDGKDAALYARHFYTAFENKHG